MNYGQCWFSGWQILWCLGLCQLASAQYIDTNSSCIQCHASELRQNDFCATVSAEVWLADDKHRRAFWLLHETDPADSERGMEKRALVRQILGFELAEAFTDHRFLRLKADTNAETARKVATVKSCLRCHATWPKEADTEFAHDPPVALDFGVSCQACHGPGEKWDQPHRLVAWRAVTPAAKQRLGFYDCRSPAAKAALCASCHVGNVSEGKFVRHEWYAAGHPPLPGFELASFQQQMPRHWKSLREKGDFVLRSGPPGDDGGQLARQFEALKRSGIAGEGIKQSYFEANDPQAIAKGIDPSQKVAAAQDAAIGGAVVLEAYARMLAETAEAASRGQAAWPELALYDCGACHHELRGVLGPSSRPERRHAPGRPPLAGWTTALARLTAIPQTDSEEIAAAERWSAVDKNLQSLERAFTARPFGDPAAVQPAALAVAEAVALARQEASLSIFDQTAARRTIHVLTSSESQRTLDFAVARQTAWAIQAILRDLEDPQAQVVFQANGRDPLALQLPAGPHRSVLENLARWLPAAAHYDSEWFAAQLQDLHSQR